jgi:signal peptidase I
LSQVESNPNILFADILDKGLDLRLKVTGQSMLPFIRSGEIVTLKKVPCSTLRCWDIVLYMNISGSLILHRIVMKDTMQNGEISFVTRGDALIQKDTPVTEHQILGKASYVEKIVPGLGPRKINLDSSLCRGLNLIYGVYKNLRHTFLNRTMLRRLFLIRQ